MIHFSLDNRYTHLRGLAPKQGRQRNHLQELQPQHRRPLHPALHKLQIFLRFSGDQVSLIFLAVTLIPSTRRRERHQTLFNALGSTATNLKTSSGRWIKNLLLSTQRIELFLIVMLRWVTRWLWTTPSAQKPREPPRSRRCDQTQPPDTFTALMLRRWVPERLFLHLIVV